MRRAQRRDGQCRELRPVLVPSMQTSAAPELIQIDRELPEPHRRHRRMQVTGNSVGRSRSARRERKDLRGRASLKMQCVRFRPRAHSDGTRLSVEQNEDRDLLSRIHRRRIDDEIDRRQKGTAVIDTAWRSLITRPVPLSAPNPLVESTAPWFPVRRSTCSVIGGGVGS